MLLLDVIAFIILISVNSAKISDVNLFAYDSEVGRLYISVKKA